MRSVPARGTRAPVANGHGGPNPPQPQLEYQWGNIPRPNSRGPTAAADRQRFELELRHNEYRGTYTTQARAQLVQLNTNLKDRIRNLEASRAPAAEVKVWKDFLKREDHADAWVADF